MMIALQASRPDALASWPEILACFLLPAIGVVAEYRFRTGWGDDGATLRAQGAWGEFLARFGYVFLPFTVAMFAWVLAAASVRLAHETGLHVFAYLALALALTGLVAFMWGIKEYRKPSRWRHRPAWLVEFERDQRRR